MVQDQAGAAEAAEPFVAGGLGAAVEDNQVVGVQQHPQPAADEPHRHRVGIATDADLPVDLLSSYNILSLLT